MSSVVTTIIISVKHIFLSITYHHLTSNGVWGRDFGGGSHISAGGGVRFCTKKCNCRNVKSSTPVKIIEPSLLIVLLNSCIFDLHYSLSFYENDTRHETKVYAVQKIARGSHILHRCSEVGGWLKYFWYFEYGLTFFADTFEMH